MYSLFIDTHDKKVTIVLYKDGNVLNIIDEVTSNKHSIVTMPSIRKIIEDSFITVNDISEIYVVNGPGSFTGERIAVTIAKTMAYCLNIPIKTIDALTILAINVDDSIKIVSIPDRNGAFVGKFDSNNQQLEEFVYLNKSSYEELKNNNKIYYDIDINYEKVYKFLLTSKSLNAHEVKPLYIKGISALNDK